MSVTLINIFEVPAGDEDEFIAAWENLHRPDEPTTGNGRFWTVCPLLRS